MFIRSEITKLQTLREEQTDCPRRTNYDTMMNTFAYMFGRALCFITTKYQLVGRYFEYSLYLGWFTSLYIIKKIIKIMSRQHEHTSHCDGLAWLMSERDVVSSWFPFIDGVSLPTTLR
jgi:hypothetical protein